MYNFYNFHRGTYANFQECEIPNLEPTYYSFSGSTYWDLGDRVVRWSDHWGKVRSCYWLIDHWKIQSNQCIAGMCFYKNFTKHEK